jgi:hypothetical protein
MQRLRNLNQSQKWFKNGSKLKPLRIQLSFVALFKKVARVVVERTWDLFKVPYFCQHSSAVPP